MSALPADHGTLSQHDVHRILEHKHRRTIVEIIADQEEIATEKLAIELAKRCNEPSDAMMTDLQHIHLPMLADYGVITRGLGRVAPTLLVDVLDRALDCVEQSTIGGGSA